MLFAIVVSNLGTVKSYAVRAESPAAAMRLLLDADGGPSRHFDHIDVYKLEEIITVGASDNDVAVEVEA